MLAITLGLVTAPLAGAQQTIDQLVQNTGARESPIFAYLEDNGFGYLDAQRASDDGKIDCANRKAGVPPYQITQLLQSRG